MLRTRVGVDTVFVGLVAAVLLATPPLTQDAAEAACPVTARQVALAGSGATAAVGVEALWASPANLAAPNRPAFSLMLVSAAGGVSNNSFTIDQYNRFMAPGTYLSGSDKEEILGSITGDEFVVRAEGAANCLGLAIGPVGFAITPRAFGSIALSKDYFDLLLNGNALNRVYSFDGTSGESMVFFETSLSYARRSSWIPLTNGRWGLGVKMFHGGAYFEVLDADGELVTSPTKASGEGLVKIRYSGSTEAPEGDGDYETSPGRGFGFDLGVAGEISTRWSLAVVLRDVGSRITWDHGTEKSYHYRADSLTAENAEDEDLVLEEEYEHAVGSLRIPVPTTLHLECTRETPRFLFSTAYDQGFRRFAGVSTIPRLAVGTELRAPAWLPVRASLSLGGGMGTCLAGGLGLHLGGLSLDLAGMKRGISGNKGGLVALTTYLRF